MSLGTLGAIVLPFPIPAMAGAVGLLVFALMYFTRSGWAWMFNPTIATVAYIGVPFLVGWAVRKARPEGRSIFAYAHGWLHSKATTHTPHAPRLRVRSGGVVHIIPEED